MLYTGIKNGQSASVATPRTRAPLDHARCGVPGVDRRRPTTARAMANGDVKGASRSAKKPSVITDTRIEHEIATVASDDGVANERGGAQSAGGDSLSASPRADDTQEVQAVPSHHRHRGSPVGSPYQPAFGRLTPQRGTVRSLTTSVCAADDHPQGQKDPVGSAHSQPWHAAPRAPRRGCRCPVSFAAPRAPPARRARRWRPHRPGSPWSTEPCVPPRNGCCPPAGP